MSYFCWAWKAEKPLLESHRLYTGKRRRRLNSQSKETHARLSHSCCQGKVISSQSPRYREREDSTTQRRHWNGENTRHKQLDRLDFLKVGCTINLPLRPQYNGTIDEAAASNSIRRVFAPPPSEWIQNLFFSFLLLQAMIWSFSHCHNWRIRKKENVHHLMISLEQLVISHGDTVRAQMSNSWWNNNNNL